MGSYAAAGADHFRRGRRFRCYGLRFLRTQSDFGDAVTRSATRLIVLCAILPLSCTPSEGDDDATVHAAYAALMDSMTGPSGYTAIPGARLTISVVRSIETQPGAPSSVIATFAETGIPVVRPETPLCPGDYRLAFGPAQPESRHVYLIEVDVLSMSEYGLGDSEIFEYRVDCRTGSCVVAGKTQLEQGEIGGSGQCAGNADDPRL